MTLTNKSQKSKQIAPKVAGQDTASLGTAESEARKQGRWLLLKFIGGDKPELDRIEFRWSKESKSAYWQQGDPPEKEPMTWSALPQALAVIFLDYLCQGTKAIGPAVFCDANSGGYATTLGNALSGNNGELHELFVEWVPPKAPLSRLKKVFAGKNFRRKCPGERRIFIVSEALPLECIDLYWSLQGPEKVTDPGVIQDLAKRVRKSLELPFEQPRSEENESRSETPSRPAPTEVPTPPPPPAPPIPPKEPTPKPPLSPPVSPPVSFPPTSVPPAAGAILPPFPELEPRQGLISTAFAEGMSPEQICLGLRADGVVTTVDRVQAFCRTLPCNQRSEAHLPPEPKTPPQQISEPSTTTPPADPVGTTQNPAEPKTPSQESVASPPRPPYTPRPIPPIEPALFEIQNPEELEWEDSMPLLDFGCDGSEDDFWSLKDACEGVLILGAPGSGKTSATGFAFAATFLSSGFGGLVLVAKPEEARRWQKLCERFGRSEDCVVVRRDGPYRLNAIAYETQRPGERPGMTDDLIEFFRVLIAVITRRSTAHGGEDFWTNTTNQLMRELFEAFLLAGEPLTMDSLMRFVTKAPELPVKNWATIPFFGDILQRAEQSIRTEEDRRIFEGVRDYWTVAYPGIAHQTRSGIVLGFTAMANALSGRGIHSLISSETTLTPEMILSGKVVILDLPVKECGQGGLLIQAAWKFLFQRAIERRVDKGFSTARPVFLWEDEGHLFFSQHDIEFQPTARDCRAAHVVISQSLHNFQQLGHNPHAVQGVFAAMNTQVFHANGDTETNQWASEKLGTTIKTLVNVSLGSQPKRSSEPGHWFWDMGREEERESTSTTSVNQQREKAFPPEEFTKLKKGGDGTCEAVVLWLSHQFKANKNRPFLKRAFEQDAG